MGERSPNGFRKCKRCGEIKPISEYSTKTQLKKQICDLCKLPAQEKLYNSHAERMKAYYKRHPDKNPNYISREDRQPKDGHKLCSKCKQILTLKYFSKSNSNKCGYSSQCKICKGQKYLSTDEYKASITRTCKHCGKSLPLNKFTKTGKTCSECKNKPLQKYTITSDSERKRCEDYRRKARKAGLAATFTYKQWVSCKKSFNNKCAYCGKEKDLTQDHFIPSTNNGEYTRNNIIPVCHLCNSTKRDLDFFEWYSQQEFYSKEREEKILDHLNYHDNFQQLMLG